MTIERLTASMFDGIFRKHNIVREVMNTGTVDRLKGYGLGATVQVVGPDQVRMTYGRIKPSKARILYGIGINNEFITSPKRPLNPFKKFRSYHWKQTEHTTH